MTRSMKLAEQAENDLLQTVRTLTELCREREKEKMSFSKYRRLITELKDLSKLLAIYNRSGVDKRTLQLTNE